MIHVARITPSHVNHENCQEREQTSVRISGENPTNKEADIVKQVGQLSGTLYQSDAPPRYEDVTQLQSTELDTILDDQYHGSIHTLGTIISPPPSYQSVTDISV